MTDASPRPLTVPQFIAAKAQGKKLAVVTAYDHLWAGISDAAGIDAILVGDTVGMVVQGHSTTLPVTVGQMIYHAEMVCRAVKLEGGVTQSDTIRALANAEVPVMAHVGLRPQAVRKLGGMGKVQRDEEQLLADAHAAQDAGAFAIVLELIPRTIAGRITKELTIPTIGIGAGPDCDGQVLVGPDLLGLTGDFHPKFLKKYADLRTTAINAIRQYTDEVHAGAFPANEHSHV